MANYQNEPVFDEICGKPVKLFVMDRQVERMMPLHFRGWQTKKAGNFCRSIWEEPADVLQAFKVELLEEVSLAISEKDFKVRSVEIEADTPVGWSSTSDTGFNKNLMQWYERFEPNYHSTALRFTADAPYLAPLTKTITLIYQVFEQGEGYNVSFKSMYPGHDIGELDGDITRNEGVIFFDWEHTGAPLGETVSV